MKALKLAAILIGPKAARHTASPSCGKSGLGERGFSDQHLLVLAIVFSLSVACAPEMPQKIVEVRNYNATFLCDGTKMMKISFTPFSALLESDGASANLTQQPAADGFLYTDGGQSLRAHGDEATWTDSHGGTHQCREQTAKTP